MSTETTIPVPPRRNVAPARPTPLPAPLSSPLAAFGRRRSASIERGGAPATGSAFPARFAGQAGGFVGGAPEGARR